MNTKLYRNFCPLFLMLLGLLLLGCETKIPEFAGIYIISGGQYQEIPRFKDFKKEKFNHIFRKGWGPDFNIKQSIPRNKFIPIDQKTFNKKGFLVVQNKEWSEIKLYRVPTKNILKDNENGADIVTSIGYGSDMGGMIGSRQSLHEKQIPTEIEIRQAKKGDNSFVYITSSPVDKGYYLIDYKLNGKGHLGYNPIVIN